MKIGIKTQYWDKLTPSKAHWRMTLDTMLFAGTALVAGGTLGIFLWVIVALRMPALISYFIWQKKNPHAKV